MRLISVAYGVALAIAAGPALAQAPAAAPAPTAKAPTHYSTSTTKLSVLLADPAAKAVLVKNLPALAGGEGGPGGDQTAQMADMTLQEVKAAVGAYAPDTFNDKVLAQIDADLAKLPAK